jgi:pimeloyl-ACP methyl ester carboxylesterase
VRGEEIVQGAEYVNSCAEWRMVLVDLRNHGRSAGIKGIVPPHDLSTAVKDLADLVKARGWA